MCVCVYFMCLIGGGVCVYPSCYGTLCVRVRVRARVCAELLAQPYEPASVTAFSTVQTPTN